MSWSPVYGDVLAEKKIRRSRKRVMFIRHAKAVEIHGKPGMWLWGITLRDHEPGGFSPKYGKIELFPLGRWWRA